MKKDFVIIFLITGIFLLPVFSFCNAAPAPSTEYDLINYYNASLDLSNNGENKETVTSWWIEEGHIRYCEGEGCDSPKEDWRPYEVHGFVNHNEDLIIKNNGFVNLTNVTIIQYHNIKKIIPVLKPGEEILVIRRYDYDYTEIFTEQEVYAKFYVEHYSPPNYWVSSIALIIYSIIFLFFAVGIFFGVKYKKTRKKWDRNICIISMFIGLIILLILIFLFIYASGMA